MHQVARRHAIATSQLHRGPGAQLIYANVHHGPRTHLLGRDAHHRTRVRKRVPDVCRHFHAHASRQIVERHLHPGPTVDFPGLYRDGLADDACTRRLQMQQVPGGECRVVDGFDYRALRHRTSLQKKIPSRCHFRGFHKHHHPVCHGRPTQPNQPALRGHRGRRRLHIHNVRMRGPIAYQRVCRDLHNVPRFSCICKKLECAVNQIW